MHKLSGSFRDWVNISPWKRKSIFENLNPPFYSIGQQVHWVFFVSHYHGVEATKPQDLPSTRWSQGSQGAIQSKLKGLRIKGQQCRSWPKSRSPQTRAQVSEGRRWTAQLTQREGVHLLPPPSCSVQPLGGRGCPHTLGRIIFIESTDLKANLSWKHPHRPTPK